MAKHANPDQTLSEVQTYACDCGRFRVVFLNVGGVIVVQWEPRRPARLRPSEIVLLKVAKAEAKAAFGL